MRKEDRQWIPSVSLSLESTETEDKGLPCLFNNKRRPTVSVGNRSKYDFKVNNFKDYNKNKER